ncbi:MAG: isoleucine--tRNA ligase [Rhizobiales bacterium]|nr:isoleucine--tRNA ligase [Hyphomicrobiales bacterium]
MSDQKTSDNPSPNVDYSDTLFLPKTDFPMRAGLPEKEPQILARWQKQEIYKTLRQQSKGREKFVLHDGPPYANGNLHIGHALNKILKDTINRSFQMMGYDANYVPGWDCHGLPIEWKIEEQYRAKGRNKDDVPINEFRQECRDFAQHWVGVQSQEFKRLGIEGDFERPYLTMNFEAEAHIANELMKFATTGQLYRGSKPIMWSVVERTALAEAEIEYQTVESDTVWVKFPVRAGKTDDLALAGASVVIWTTTPWTVPGNRAVCYSSKISYGLYRVTGAENAFGPQPNELFVFADKLAEDAFTKAKLTYNRLRQVAAEELAGLSLDHPLAGYAGGYDFLVPMLDGDHVTDDAGTGFVHTAPGHGRDDFEIWVSKRIEVEARGIDASIPFTVDDAGFYTKDAPGFEGARVIDDSGKKGDANDRIIKALIAADKLFARGRLKHEYPHSWRSKKPIIFRNTPQWFVYMDKDDVCKNGSLRQTALDAIDATRFVPAAGQNRLRGMIEQRPDWVLSRQRAWGVPISVFVDENGNVLKSDKVNAAIFAAFKAEGADAWYAEGAKERFFAADPSVDPAQWQKVNDILDVWFDSGSTHAFCLEQREDLKWPADVYLEGSDQHRGWFHSSLLESCGTRGRAPYETVITHGFTMDEQGRKMSKSLGNVTAPQEIIREFGADILRLWVVNTDYADDQRIGKEIIKTNVDAYRRLRNTVRWMLGTLAHYDGGKPADMPELERYMLHRLAETEAVVLKAYRDFDFKKAFNAVFNLMNSDMSSFYFDIRKDALYCDPLSSTRRLAALYVVDHLYRATVTWLAPMLPFTMDEAWISRYGEGAASIHLEGFAEIGSELLDPAIAARWEKIRKVRRVVTGALEIARAEKRIGSSLEAAPRVFISDGALAAALDSVDDFDDLCITSAISVVSSDGPQKAFRMDEIAGVAVEVERAEGRKCARSWRISKDVGLDADYPDITPRDAQAMRERAGTR